MEGSQERVFVCVNTYHDLSLAQVSKRKAPHVSCHDESS